MNAGRITLALALAACLCQGFAASTDISKGADKSVQHLKEERIFLAAYAKFYDPDYWISYEGKLYFLPSNSTTPGLVSAHAASFESFAVLTNTAERLAVITNAMVRGGFDAELQKAIPILPSEKEGKLKLPRLTERVVRVTGFKSLQSLENGDVLIEVDDTTYYVYGVGPLPDGKDYGAMTFIKKGLKSFQTVLGARRTVEALSVASFGLFSEQEQILRRVSKSLQRRVSELDDMAREWPKQCLWPDRTLEDGRKVNLRPLFNWLANEAKAEAKQTKRKPNPMPAWTLLSGKVFSTKGDEAIVDRFAWKDESGSTIESTEKPFVVRNHPEAKAWTQGMTIPGLYALKVGEREIERQGQKTKVDVYDHGKTFLTN